MSGGHMSGKGEANTNGHLSADRDTGHQRAADRASMHAVSHPGKHDGKHVSKPGKRGENGEHLAVGQKI
ncbi:hypothetical protein NH14_017950 [Paraburkholderia sacchari]|uniref:Uncharacterized protein n=3 Tax=Paraburkholderia sacchari TaxID=159450 RepID=A0A8T6ZHD3_9BURK|nr:hypothetical protein [Paraburkholderia sacchari]